ncbi:MAG: WGR domain-containing protein [Limimaricola soesokkakensis]|uniref:WGR domain protein n=1 Tax=Limimaricola soesokkakensis TaxID=1343159 RepID=A0A1X6Z6E7_9RHOB|nr:MULTISPECIES: WGR domain-containing protein [Limimaricola]MCZ4259671.1 WGR domain-containing protein [Limimaricola sp. G21655-S1]PSK86768.1 putative DNA-binding WGR domain protein [Limimaricola soesokkakensis]SLN41665.1 WGR domain protein [Limimaricola soesokkakensis]
MEIHLEKIDARRNCYRFYEITVEPDLFAQAALVVRWGRIGGRGRSRIAGSGSVREAQDLATRLLKLRLRHGYALR